MIDLELIRLELSSLIFDNLVNLINNYSKMKDIYEKLKGEYSENYAQLIFLDIFSNILVKSNKTEYLSILDSVYTNIFTDFSIIPVNLLKQDIINQNDYSYSFDKKINFYKILLNEPISQEIYLHYNNLLIKNLILSGEFLKDDYKLLYNTAKDKNEELVNILDDYNKIKKFLAFFN